MCESNLFLLKNGQEELLVESVDKIVVRPGEICVEDIMGRKRSIKGNIKEMSLLEHKILVEEPI